MSDLPTYPQEAAEREEAAGPPGARSDYASWGRRVGAYLVDTILLAAPLVALAVLALAAGDPDDENDTSWAVVGFAYLGWIVLPFVYFAVLHGRESGQTLGKRWLGIRVVDEDSGRSIGYARGFGRYAITFLFGLFIIPVLLDYLWPLWDKKNQSLHDKVVSSVVVRA
jgi:uncharacterized RDD family membrane protein YckC